MKKKIWQRVLPVVLCLVMIAAVMSGCSPGRANENGTAESPGSKGSQAQDSAGMRTPAPSEPEYDLGLAGSESQRDENSISGNAGSVAGGGNISSEKLIRTVYLSGETRAFEDALAGIKSAVESLGGYIESASNTAKARNLRRFRPQRQHRRPHSRRKAGCLYFGGQRRGRHHQPEQQRRKRHHPVPRLRSPQSPEIQLQRLESILTEVELADVLALETEIARVRYELETIETTCAIWTTEWAIPPFHRFLRADPVRAPRASEQPRGQDELRLRPGDRECRRMDQGHDRLVQRNFIGLIVLAAIVVLAVKLIARYNRKRGYVSARKSRRGKRRNPP